jgi:aquaporin Z
MSVLSLQSLSFGEGILYTTIGMVPGSLLVVLVWGGGHAASVGYRTTVPGAGHPLWVVFLAEVSLTFLLVLSIFVFVSHRRLMCWTPLMVWILVAVMVWLEAPLSGTSLNPARSFGPALVSWFWSAHWLYWVAPPLGALLAVIAFRLMTAGERDVLTGKLFHVPHYRSVFKNVSAPCMPAMAAQEADVSSAQALRPCLFPPHL